MSSPTAWSALGRWVSRVSGLAFGAGLRANLGDAYTWLIREWTPGDRIYLFGFSRGAYTARALAGVLRAIGILRPGAENLVPYVIATYARPAGNTQADFPEFAALARAFARPHEGHTAVQVQYFGGWDTVKSVGVLRWQTVWPWTRQLPYVQEVRHAVSIDEHRRPFTEYLVTPTAVTQLDEVWFAGTHSDIGGTFTDDPRLSQITLRWILDGAVAAGLLLDPNRRDTVPTRSSENAAGRLHQTGPLWSLLGRHRRRIPVTATVHTSVRERIAQLPDYRPVIPSTVTWTDSDWVTRPPT